MTFTTISAGFFTLSRNAEILGNTDDAFAVPQPAADTDATLAAIRSIATTKLTCFMLIRALLHHFGE